MRKSLPRLKGVKLLSLLVLGFLAANTYAEDPRASSDPNQLLAFKKIYIDPPTDNIDGAFRQTFEQAYRDVLDRNPRFDRVSEKSQADSVVTTKIEKNNSGIECELTLVLNPSGDVFTVEKIKLPAQATGSELTAGAKRALKSTLKRIPFYGSISGMEGETLTFDIGASNGIQQGDVVQIARVDHIKKHPLLKSIIDVEMVPVGTAEVESVEGTIAFGKVKQEIPGEKIQRTFKVTSVEARENANARKIEFPEDGFDASRDRIDPAEYANPEIGFVGLGPFLGFFSSASSQSNGATILSGSGFNPGLKLFGELWLTKNWFLDASYGYGFSSLAFTEERSLAKSSTFSTTMSDFHMDVGYRHFIWNSTKGPNVHVKIGYGTFSWTPPVDTTQLLGPRKYGGMRLGIGGSMPIKPKVSGINLGIVFGLFNSYTQQGFTLSPDTTQSPSSTIAHFDLGYYFYFMSNMAFRASFIADLYSVEYSGGLINYGASNSSQRQVGVVPSILYYF